MKLARTLGLLLIAGVSAFATSVTFTFDTQTINGIVVNGLSSGATASQIATYMNQVLAAAGGCPGCSVTVLVSGSSVGAVADQTYNGDGHVTGPGNGSTSLTLGDSTGATASNTNSTIGSTDTFIANTSDGKSQISQQITLQFHGIAGLTVTSFDYEIFPDGSCSALTSGSCGGAPTGGIYPNQPDLEFAAGTSTNGAVGAGGDTIQKTYYGVTPDTSNGMSGTIDGTATHSPNSGSSNSEAAPQLIGTWNGSLTGATELDFVDWPATIGIDNLAISYNTTNPEPASLVLLGTLVGGLLLRKKLKAS